MVVLDNSVKRVEIHVIIGCADARDLSDGFVTALKDVKDDAKKKGTLIDDQRMAVAGTYMTPEIVGECKTMVFSKMAEYFEYRNAGVPVEFYIHINAHGDAHLKAGADRLEHSAHNIEITPGAKTNCGMMGASGVSREIEQLLLKEKPTIGDVKINSEADIRKMMKKYYGFDGSAASWLTSIVDLAEHPKAQKEELRRNFDADTTIKNLHIHITAGVQNYETNEYLRVDANKQPHMRVTFLDRVYEKMRKNGKPSDHAGRTSKQDPELGLFHQTSIIDARKTAYELVRGGNHSAGKVFGIGIGDKTAVQDFRPFDRYQIGGFFYATTHLKIKEWVVMGKNQKETDMMVKRLENDKLCSFFAKHFNVTIKPLPLDKAISESLGIDKRIKLKQGR